MQTIHKAAFRLNQYQCTKCMAIEHVWNSRDGYIPFNIMCGSCGGQSSKLEGDGKVFKSLPSYALRVFVDVTEAEAKDYAKSQLEYLLSEGPDEAKKVLADPTEAARFIEAQVNEIYGKGNRPHTIFRREYLERIENEKRD